MVDCCGAAQTLGRISAHGLQDVVACVWLPSNVGLRMEFPVLPVLWFQKTPICFGFLAKDTMLFGCNFGITCKHLISSTLHFDLIIDVQIFGGAVDLCCFNAVDDGLVDRIGCVLFWRCTLLVQKVHWCIFANAPGMGKVSHRDWIDLSLPLFEEPVASSFVM